MQARHCMRWTPQGRRKHVLKMCQSLPRLNCSSNQPDPRDSLSENSLPETRLAANCGSPVASDASSKPRNSHLRVPFQQTDQVILSSSSIFRPVPPQKEAHATTCLTLGPIFGHPCPCHAFVWSKLTGYNSGMP